jgi:hypothetical protein
MLCTDTPRLTLMAGKAYRTSIAIPTNIRDALQKRADREGRSMSNMIERLVIAGLIASGDLPPEQAVVKETRGRKPKTEPTEGDDA